MSWIVDLSRNESNSTAGSVENVINVNFEMTHKNFSKFTKLLEIYSRTNSGNNFQEIGSGSFGKVHPVIRRALLMRG
ncbi:hypothetical protein RIR_jg29243.t1 [Rhizophagus irregularis DAOM 181602=DAOM 197198]|uniref:Uncharacterized protein n=1 Tax=Rhizophagus irregularis (strain DAOM 181602 / DAOM 197198 / MUCL 43194) TaxID=747089 RepID=U9SXZ5_RHIID|nr:hypothetical protein RIR_jg29243.t1 [Rhizophagus irregularis DAOM 181602=DAOM 197198]